MKQLALLGASGHGKVLADMAGLLGWERVVFFDDAWPALQHNGAWAVEGNTDDLMRRLPAFDGVVVSIGHGATRWAKQQALQHAGACIATIDGLELGPELVAPLMDRGDGQTQRNGAQGHVEAEVHRPQHDAVKRNGAQVRAGQPEPPGPEDGDQQKG